MRKIEGRRDQDVRELRRLRRFRNVTSQQCAAGLDQRRQHDEQITGDESGEERVTRQAEHLTHPDGRQRGNETGQYPQAEEQRDGDIRHEIYLQPPELFEAERAGRGCRDCEQAKRCQPQDKSRGA